MKIKTQDLVIAALLTTLSILFPIIFQFVTIPLGPFTATFASHVPTFIAMFVSPVVALAAAIGSVVGFFLRGMPIWVVARAAMHIPVVLIGAYCIKKGVNVWVVCIVTLFAHASLEVIAVLPFLDAMNLKGALKNVQWGAYTMDWRDVIFVGTSIHHIIDFILAYLIVLPLQAAKLIKKQATL